MARLMKQFSWIQLNSIVLIQTKILLVADTKTNNQ